MRKAAAFFLIFLMMCAGSRALFAQEETEPDTGDEEEIPVEPDWGGYVPSLYSRGDKTITISAGVLFPTLFTHRGKVVDMHMAPVGGTGSLAFNYFFDAHFSIGAELGGFFNYTRAENVVFVIPIGLRGGYQFIIGKIEIPLTMSAGIAPTRFINSDLCAFFMKGGVGAYYRATPDWSFGLNANWGWYPQWTRKPEQNMDGNFIDLTLSARYHF